MDLEEHRKRIEEFKKERESHPINENYIDYGQRLGFFPVFKEQLEDETFKALPPSWKCYYFLLQSQYNLQEGAFYKRDADFAAMLNISLQSNTISKAKKAFEKNGWIKVNSGKLTSGGQRLATEYISVKWSMPTDKGKYWGKIDRASFLYLLLSLKDKPKFHDIIIVWMAMLFLNVKKNHGTVAGDNSFTLNKKDIASFTNQSQQKIKKALNCFVEEGYIKSWIEPKLNSYHIEDFIIYGHKRHGGYVYEEDEEWFKLVKPINEFLNDIQNKGTQEAEKKVISQAKATMSKYDDVFDLYKKSYEDIYEVLPFLVDESERIIQLGSLIKKVGADTIKNDIGNYFLSISLKQIKTKASISNLYNYLSKIHFQKPKKQEKKNDDYSFITDPELPF